MEKKLPFVINGQSEQVRFKVFDLKSTRMPYEIQKMMGLDENGQFCKGNPLLDCLQDDIEKLLLDFVKTGCPEQLINRGLWIVENPGKETISRNLCIFDPSSFIAYTIGGIGLVRLDHKENQLYLENPLIDISYHKYQKKNGNNEGGTIYYTDKGKVSKNNTTPVGVTFYEEGPYNLKEKIDKTEQLRGLGFNTPTYIAAGVIKNLEQGEFGFSIYKTYLTPDYLLNIGLYLDNSFNFKETYYSYLRSKYTQLSKLHFEFEKSHGQPTVTNAIGEVNPQNSDNQIACVIKDLATLTTLPSQTSKTISEGPCPQDIKAVVKKSPKVSAIINDLQVAITQEFNIILIAVSALPNDEVRMRFLQHQYPKVMGVICRSYGLLQDAQIEPLIHFCFGHFINSVKLGHKLTSFNDILGGLSAHAMIGFSQEFKDQIEFIS